MMRISMAGVVASALLVAGCGRSAPESQSKGVETGAGPGAAPGGPGAPATPGPPAAAPTGPMTMPDWMKVDRAKKSVSMQIEAGKTETNNHWNFNGFSNGGATIAVPANYTVQINFKNDDPAVAHSLGVDKRTGDFPPTFENPQPVFPKAITSKPTDPAGGVSPGKSETLSFKAATPGHYSLVCYMPGHAAAGMWVRFDVSADTAAGVRGAK
jgi:sulfocyanin